jgi:hypothetical protein
VKKSEITNVVDLSKNGCFRGGSGYLSFAKVTADPWQALVKAKIAAVLNFPSYSVLPLGLLKLIGNAAIKAKARECQE